MIVAAICGGCGTNLHTKVSGNLNHLSRNITVAILPVGTTEPGQKEAARLLRRDLYASLKQSRFHVLERYVVDGLLKQHGLTNPEDFSKTSPIKMGEILGADAVLISTMTKVKRSYFVLHSSIELGVSATLTDTRTGEILWMADQTETDFDGIGKIPTGIVSALLAPIHLVTNKLNLRRMTQKMTTKLTALVKKPNLAEKEEQFDSLMVVSAATKDIRDVKDRPVPVVREAQPEARQPIAEARGPASNPRPVPSATPEPLPVSKAVFPASSARSNAPQTAVLRPASFAGIVPSGQPPRKTQLAVLHPASRPEPAAAFLQPRPTQLAIGKIEPATAIKPAVTRRRNIQTAALKPVRIAKPQAVAKPQPAAKPDFASKPQTILYTVQVGAYENKAFARDMIGKLSRKGYRAFLTPVKKGRSLLYKVHVEKFADRGKAIRYARDFYAQEKLDNFVTTLRAG
ncbi:MAG: GNA1162 family protein [Nitrospinales bacterium]